MRGFPFGIAWWAAALRASAVFINTGERGLDRRHDHHRYAILGPGGVQWLTIPLTGDTRTPHTTLGEIRISEHANWRRTHWGALYSAYGRTPYFDYAADDLHRIIDGNQTHLLDFIRQMQQFIADFMQLPVTFHYRAINETEATKATETPPTPDIHAVPYHQLWADRHGFQPGLSIFDLMMNQGPEGVITLLRMTDDPRLQESRSTV